MLHGLLDKQYINEIKMSQTYKDDSFAREYLGIWTGGSKDSWFNYDALGKYRVLVNPEKSQKIRPGQKVFYFISVDVARFNCQTAVTVFKVFVGDFDFKMNVVYLDVLGKTEETKHFAIQAKDLKKIIDAFQPQEVLIDGNGLGVGLLDFMVLPSVDGKTVYPAYCAMNDDKYGKKLYPEAMPIINVMKDNKTLDSKIHGKCFSTIMSGKVHFLVKEQQIKNKLLSTAVGQKMRPEERVERCMPHSLTTRLFEEMANLRLKNTGDYKELKLERINSSMTKDKFSSLEYGIWRITEIEEQYYKKHRKRKKRKMSFQN